MKLKVECVFEYYDLELGKSITPNETDKNKKTHTKKITNNNKKKKKKNKTI